MNWKEDEKETRTHRHQPEYQCLHLTGRDYMSRGRRSPTLDVPVVRQEPERQQPGSSSFATAPPGSSPRAHTVKVITVHCCSVGRLQPTLNH